MLRMLLGGAVLSLGWMACGLVMIGRAEGWKTCAFNDQPIGCRDTHSPDGTGTYQESCPLGVLS